MKNLRLVLFVFLTGFFACTQKEVAPETFETEDVTTENFNIISRWSVIDAGSMVREQYQVGEIILEFKTNNILIVKTNISLPENSQIPFKTNTTYQYKNNTLSIDEGGSYDCFVYNGHLILDGGSAYDGPRYELVKLK